MIAQGMIPGVQVKRSSPLDRLLQSYCNILSNADILSVYVNAMPVSAEKISLLEQMIDIKYPYLTNNSQEEQSQIDKYNWGLAMAKKHLSKEKP